ncbi:MAG TPA: amino acid permease [Blastocatellia bacterium]|nr:amino acid permease [Blastocatellia bacterium]
MAIDSGAASVEHASITLGPSSEQAALAHQAVANEAGLVRQLSSRQLAMIAIGGAIGTGLFLGSSLAVRTAGPAVILTYAGGAVITLLIMGALSEMASAHPTAGSFGVYADVYVSGWAGFVVRYTYWAVQCIAIGDEAVAVAIYCGLWFPTVPKWVWVLVFSAALVYVNARSVGSFGEFEYWFSTIKVGAILLFILFGALVITGAVPSRVRGITNYTVDGGFFPNGLKGAWMAMAFVIFSYIGTEVVAVTAGEAREPEKAVPKAMRSMVSRLIIFYLGAIMVLVAVVPWSKIQAGSNIKASPFVTVFTIIGVPFAAHVINFVVLTAALSSMNCNLYLTSRTMFSLSRAGYAPSVFGKLTSNGAPLNALLISAAGLLIAAAVAFLYPDQAFVYLFGVSLFGGIFVWMMIFVVHLYFRPKYEKSGAPRAPVRMPGYPYTSILGAVSLAAILITTWWIEGMRVTLKAGIPWLALITVAYYVRRFIANREHRSTQP